MEIPYKPELGDIYCFYGSDIDEVYSSKWWGSAADLALFKVGNCFDSYDDAITKGKEVVKKLYREYERSSKHKPKYKDTYYFYNNSKVIPTHKVIQEIWLNGEIDLALWKIGNCFRTYEDAKTKGKELFENLKGEFEEN